MGRGKILGSLLKGVTRRPNFRKQAIRGSSSKKKKMSDLYPENWAELSYAIRKRDGWRCMIHKVVSSRRCTAYYPPPWAHKNLHAHHIVPLTDGGSNHPSNLITVCLSCHKFLHPHMQR